MSRNIRLSNALFSLMTVLFTVLFISQTVRAQFETATVLGSVRDVNEAALQNATVTLKNIGTDITQTATTDENGDMERMKKFDLDGIITDYPDRAVKVFRTPKK